ncbi:MAG TPA: glutathione S-transferase family protein [Solimonas sp.]|nr:glutathione S-transferase family protein [Solimonas sp.]
MAPLQFLCGSGSPYAWRVWLALEHKALAYTLSMQSFSAGDLKRPEFLALNPRGRVPAIVDGGFVLYESAAIVEYLEDAYPDSGARLFPAQVQARATARRLVREADQYLAHAMEQLVEQILFQPPAQWVAATIRQARDAFVQELAHFERELRGEFFAGAAGAVDFTVYPMIALALRMELKKPDLAVRAALGPGLRAWLGRVEGLPYFAATYPPHWKQG